MAWALLNNGADVNILTSHTSCLPQGTLAYSSTAHLPTLSTASTKRFLYLPQLRMQYPCMAHSYFFIFVCIHSLGVICSLLVNNRIWQKVLASHSPRQTRPSLIGKVRKAGVIWYNIGVVEVFMSAIGRVRTPDLNPIQLPSCLR